MVPRVIDIPGGLATIQAKVNGEAGRAFIAGLPALVEDFLGRWELRIDGPAMHGMTALVLPVVAADGSRAVLKLQLLDEESAGEPVALRLWNGDRAVRLLRYDEATGTMLLERLDPARMLAHVPDTHETVVVIARLLAHLTRLPAPPGLRRLGDIAGEMLEQVPWALERIPDPSQRRLVADCAAAVREVVGEPGDRLLHWDLHDENVLAAADRGNGPVSDGGNGLAVDWRAIDPKPLAGDPCFELWPALHNRYDPDDVLWRFDAMTEVLGLDRERARAWTLGRVLQNALWNVEDGEPQEADDLELARRLRDR
ncbi:aminoglycoside phosphotransferase family protein [Streptomyces sp. A012304]|uniref:aminoglycoside phosphotransferase family protein n=1 Tax=Streptomyces sp. A012304 TaxID=375446 RepID=UPI0035D4FB15